MAPHTSPRRNHTAKEERHAAPKTEGGGASAGLQEAQEKVPGDIRIAMPTSCASSSAMHVIHGIVQPSTDGHEVLTKPAGSRAVVQRSAHELYINCPPEGIGSFNATLVVGLLILLGGSIVMLVFGVKWQVDPSLAVAKWPFGSKEKDHQPSIWLLVIGSITCAFSLCCTYPVLRKTITEARLQECLVISRRRFSINASMDISEGCWWHKARVVEGYTQGLRGARVVATKVTSGGVFHPTSTVVEVIDEGSTHTRVHRFAERRKLQEQRWLVYEINSFVEELTGRKAQYTAMPSPTRPEVLFSTLDKVGGGSGVRGEHAGGGEGGWVVCDGCGRCSTMVHTYQPVSFVSHALILPSDITLAVVAQSC